MASYQVTCTLKSGTGTDHSHITHLGGGMWGPWTRESIIARIVARTDDFYTFDGFRRATVLPWPDPLLGPYLRTWADGDFNNNLLALPRCLGWTPFL